jgi:hypothetical protein
MLILAPVIVAIITQPANLPSKPLPVFRTPCPVELSVKAPTFHIVGIYISPLA